MLRLVEYWLLMLSWLCTLCSTAPLLHEPLNLGFTRRNITYGPFIIEARSMKPHIPTPTTLLPCRNCYIVAMQASLEFVDGSVANFNNGVWLHHIMQFDDGMIDPMCPLTAAGKVFHASGNERPVWRINSNGKWGYFVHDSTEKWYNGIEIMNENSTPREVQVTVTYEYVDADSDIGKEYRRANLAWVVIGDTCGNGEIPAPETDDAIIFNSNATRIPYKGPILVARGHLHDGGTDSALLVNGETVCDSTQFYGKSTGYIDEDGVDHLSGSRPCYMSAILNVDDEVALSARYSSAEHPVTLHSGKRDDVMAVMFMYIGQD